MPDKTPCPRCKKIGFVRFEHVIQRGVAERLYYCGSCAYSWRVADGGEPARGGRRPPDGSRDEV